MAGTVRGKYNRHKNRGVAGAAVGLTMTPIKKAESIQPDDGEQVKKVGDILREARLARDKELPEVAKQLRIRLEFLQAIEDNRPKDLPGNAYALGFVRTYAGFLNQDSKQLVDQFKAEVEAIENLTELNFPEPLPAKSVPGGALVFIGLLLFGLFYGLWYYLNSQGKSFTELVPELPESLQQLISGDEEDQSQAPTTTIGDPNDTAATSPAPTTSTVVETAPAPAETAPQPAAETAAVAPVETVPAAVEETLTPTVEEAQETAIETVNEGAEETAVETVVEETIATAEEATEEVSDTVTATEEAVAETAVTEVASTAPETPAAVVEETVEDAVETVTEPTAAATETADAVEPAASEDTAEPEQVAALPAAEAEETPAVIKPTSPNPLTGGLPTARPEPKVYGEENAAARVIITAKSTAWVEISSGEGNLLLTRLLNAGDSYRVPNQTGITLITGNAGALEIMVDGKKAPAIGEVGAVVRDVSLDPDKLNAGQ